jgi:hypothetical protein
MFFKDRIFNKKDLIEDKNQTKLKSFLKKYSKSDMRLKYKIIKPLHDQKYINDFSGKYVLVIIGLIIIYLIVNYFHPIVNHLFFIGFIILMSFLFNEYYSRKLIRYSENGYVVFYEELFEIINDTGLKLVRYSDIKSINSIAGLPRKIFSSSKGESLISIDLSLVLVDDSELKINLLQIPFLEKNEKIIDQSGLPILETTIKQISFSYKKLEPNRAELFYL